jgi:hypothetical protein
MRSFSSMHLLGAVGAAILLLGLVLPGQALAVTLQYTVTATVSAITVENGDTLADLTTAGIEVGSALTTTVILDRRTEDGNPAADKGSYSSDQISYSLGDGPTTFDVSGMTRDNVVVVNNDQPADELSPFPYDGFGWAGAEPTTTSGPAFLALNSSCTPEPCKGTAVGMAGGWPWLSSAALPASPSNSFLLGIVYMDLLDTSRSNATILIEANITDLTTTVTDADTPTMDAWAVAVLLVALLAGGAVLAGRRLRAES